MYHRDLLRKLSTRGRHRCDPPHNIPNQRGGLQAGELTVPQSQSGNAGASIKAVADMSPTSRQSISILQNGSVYVGVEADTLQADACDLQGAHRIELGGLINILRRSVLATGDGLFNNSLDGLRSRVK